MTGAGSINTRIGEMLGKDDVGATHMLERMDMPLCNARTQTASSQCQPCSHFCAFKPVCSIWETLAGIADTQAVAGPTDCLCDIMHDVTIDHVW